MSSTVRQAVTQSRPRSLVPQTGIKHVLPMSIERCSDQKRMFDQRRDLKLAEDKDRLHLDDIQGMISPKRGADVEDTSLLPPVESLGVPGST